MQAQVDREVADGGAFVPEDNQASRFTDPITQVEASPVFQMVFDPQRWTVIGGQVVPFFYPLYHVGGLNGCDERRDRHTGLTRVTTSHARETIEAQGHTILPYDAIPDEDHLIHGKAGTPRSYLWKPRGRSDVTLLIYTRVFPGNKRIEQDEPRYLRWCTWLEDNGYIKPCPSYILRDMLARKEAERASLSDKAHTNPSLVPEVARLSRDVEAIRAQLERREAKEVRTPVGGEAFEPEPEPEPEAAPTPEVTAKGRR